jgi:hypothetical protein
MNMVSPIDRHIIGTDLSLLVAPSIIWAAFENTDATLNVMPE